MENPNDYLCPKVCPLRSSVCHSACFKHKKYRRLIEERREAKERDRRPDTVATQRTAFKYNQKWV